MFIGPLTGNAATATTASALSGSAQVNGAKVTNTVPLANLPTNLATNNGPMPPAMFSGGVGVTNNNGSLVSVGGGITITNTGYNTPPIATFKNQGGSIILDNSGSLEIHSTADFKMNNTYGAEVQVSGNNVVLLPNAGGAINIKTNTGMVAPTAGYISLCTSNGALYKVSMATTNLISAP